MLRFMTTTVSLFQTCRTGMPAMGLVLPARDLRDVVAYVMSLSLEETADE